MSSFPLRPILLPREEIPCYIHWLEVSVVTRQDIKKSMRNYEELNLGRLTQKPNPI